MPLTLFCWIHVKRFHSCDKSRYIYIFQPAQIFPACQLYEEAALNSKSSRSDAHVNCTQRLIRSPSVSFWLPAAPFDLPRHNGTPALRTSSQNWMFLCRAVPSPAPPLRARARAWLTLTQWHTFSRPEEGPQARAPAAATWARWVWEHGVVPNSRHSLST